MMGRAMTQIWVCALVALVLCGLGAVDARTRRRVRRLVAVRCERVEIVAVKLYRRAKRPILSPSHVRRLCASAGLSIPTEDILAENRSNLPYLSDARDTLRRLGRSLLQAAPERARARYLSLLGREASARWKGLGSPTAPTPIAGSDK